MLAYFHRYGWIANHIFRYRFSDALRCDNVYDSGLLFSLVWLSEGNYIIGDAGI